MSLIDKLDRIDELQAEILAAGELDAEVKKRINYKFRLDWNYHSNSMEGNTLTKEETRSVMVGNLTVGGKPYKDVAEMRGHDEVVTELLKIGKSEVRLSESRVKDIHRSIMHEEDLEKRSQIGEWKSKDNYVLNYKGERFDFKSYTEVADEMHGLLNFINAKTDRIIAGKEDLHPLLVASKFHLKFVSIHPFYDGNGRMGRLLSNLFLISQGYPPIIIKTEEKEKYNRYLADIQAYGGNDDLLSEFFAELLIRSQQMVLDVIAGKSIEEPEDIDKEIDLFKREFEETPIADVPEKTNELVASVSLSNLLILFEKLEIKHRAINELFTSTEVLGIVNSLFQAGGIPAINDLVKSILSGENTTEIQNLGLTVHHFGFKRNGLDFFDLRHHVTLKFDDVKFIIGDNLHFEKTFVYNQLPSEQELGLMISEMMRGVMDEIKKKSGNGVN
ncbi:MAG: Fic family protein [Bacteroidia bacterium]|jgi:Fic family protein